MSTDGSGADEDPRTTAAELRLVELFRSGGATAPTNKPDVPRPLGPFRTGVQHPAKPDLR
jgi:hypothetical protein